MKENLKVFPARTSKKVKVIEVVDGFGIEFGSPIKAYLPGESEAYQRTVRFHEAQHINHTPIEERACYRELSNDAKMGIEDVMLHTRYMPEEIPKSVLEDEAKAAQMDLNMAKEAMQHIRDMKVKGEPVDVRIWNSMCVAGIRSTAILKRQGIRYESPFSNGINKVFNKILKHLASRLDKQAADLFQALLTPPEINKPGTYDIDDTKTATGEVPSRLKWDPDTECHRRVYKHDCKSDGGEENKMPYREMRMDTKTVARKYPYMRHLSTGAVPDGFKLARASFSPMTDLFKVRRQKEKGGAYLFDASGSMGVTTVRLARVAARVPAATIAFYSGTDTNPGGGAGLVVYAKNGMRSSDDKIAVTGGNDWDHQALQWLLKQKGPLVFVTDQQFCGGSGNQNAKAHALLEQNIGRVTVHPSYDALEQALTKEEKKEKDGTRNTSYTWSGLPLLRV